MADSFRHKGLRKQLVEELRDRGIAYPQLDHVEERK